jgi:hypothetical protein
LFFLRLIKNVTMNMIKIRPTTPTIANTKPEAALFCRKDVLLEELVLRDGGATKGDSTTTVVVTRRGDDELEMLSVEEAEDAEVEVEVEETTEEEETLLDDLVRQFSIWQPNIMKKGGHTIQLLRKLNFVT